MFHQGAHHPTVLVVLQALTATIGEVLYLEDVTAHCMYLCSCALECSTGVTAEKQDQDSIFVASGASLT